jgi:serine/threonine protein kinase
VSERREPRLLLVLEGDTRPGAELPQAGMLVIGSSTERAAFVVQGEGVADVHCALGRTKGGGFAVKDLGSAGGTRVNGQVVESARVGAGDAITIGSRRLRIVDPARPDAAPSPRARSGETQSIQLVTPPPVTIPSGSPAAANAGGSEPRAPTAGDPRPAEKSNSSTRFEKAPMIAGYRIAKQLGRGGMGTVYLAVQESLQREVALKVLAAKLEADVEFVRRFQAEARSAAALNHPNIVTVFDVGEDRGTHYLSMEYMDRGNLEERVCKGARIEWREVLSILHDAASGLVYAESRKIVHRDLKPANLMQNHTGVTKIADLGLATHVEAEEAAGADKKIFGTPHFMSPEQARGERVDSRSDLYSLGATAYRLLTGHTPFEGESSRDILRAHLRDEARSMRDFVPDLPDDVVACVSKLMQKDPAQRFASAADLLRDIDRQRGALRSATSIATTPARPRSRARLVAVAAIVVVAASALYWMSARSGASKPRAEDRGRSDRAFANSAASNGAVESPDASSTTPTSAASASTATKVDDDKALQLFEANARVAFLELASREMDAPAKRDELRALAGRFRGTTAASEALEKADAIEADIERSARESGERTSALEGLVARLRQAAALDANPPRPGDAFEKMRAIEGQAAFAQDPSFQSAKKSIELAVVQNASAHARAVLDETQRDLDAGRFEAVQQKLDDLVKSYELPDFPPGQAPSGIDELFTLTRSARERLSTLELSRGHFAEKQAQASAVEIAAGFGGATGLEHEIRTLDMAAAKARLSAIAAKLPPGAMQTFVKDLAADCERGGSVLATIGRECTAGGWRRKTFSDPRDKKNSNRVAVGADASGILCETDGGGVETVPWSAFGANAKELSKVFWERTTREYTPDELRAIAGLIRMTAVVEAIDRTSKMFDRAKHANFSEGNAHDLAECFVPLQPWLQKLGGDASLAREAQAAALLAQVLTQTTDGSWSAAVAGTERLLHEFQDTLLVRLMSDGTTPEPARAPKAAIPPPDAAETPKASKD